MANKVPHIFLLIGQRASALAARAHQEMDPVEVAIEVWTVHEKTALRLTELLEAEDHHFSHDVFGIRKNLDVVTGTLKNCFRPRYCQRELP